MFSEIAWDLLKSDIDFFAGGGSKFFMDSTGLYPFGEYNIEINFSKLQKIRKPEPGKRYGFLLGQERMPATIEGRGDFLAKASSIAVEFLSTGDKGYFLMVEGAQIDWAGHGNQVEYMISEVNDFERTVNEVLDYADDSRDAFWALIKGQMIDYMVDEESGETIRGSESQLDSFEELWRVKREPHGWVLDEIDQEVTLSDFRAFKTASEVVA